MSEWNDALFQGTEQLYGARAMARFRDARVAVIGLGGVGSWTVEALARSGVGHLMLMDLDDICVTNTNRQLHATRDRIGQFKVDVMAERGRSINPALQVDARCQFLTPDNLQQAGLEQMDFIVDAIDSVRPKVQLIPYLRRQGLPFVMTGGAGGLTDPTRIRRHDLAAATHDPLAARVRQQLRRRHGFPPGGRKLRVPCVTSDEPMAMPQQAAPDGSPGSGGLGCAGGLGASVVVTATFGLVAAAAALDHLAHAAG